MDNFIYSTKYSRIKREEFKYLNTFHEDWTIYVVISGSFRCKFQGHEDIMQKGDLYFIPPFVNFERHVIETLTVHFIRFKLDQSVKPPFTLPTGKITLTDSSRLQSTLQMLSGFSKAPQSNENAYLCHLLCDLFIQYYYENNHLFQSPTNINDPLVTDIINYFKNNYQKKLNMREVASAFGLPPSGLIFKFRKSTGILPMRHLINIRIKKAKQLLVDTSLPLSEIAEQTGFENSYYFSTAFKKEVGLSPSEYRKTYMI